GENAEYRSERWAHDFRPLSSRLIKRLRKEESGIGLGSRSSKKKSVGRPALRENNPSNDAKAQSNPSEQQEDLICSSSKGRTSVD
ncbi:hypothetical protein Ancab_015526, partial [Ancistrocladus abbreviatus]